MYKGQAAIRDWFRARHDRTGNLPVLPGIFPDQMAPIVRTGADGEHELFGFLTTEANAVVAPIQPKAMPAILPAASA
jgi:putative SOS response-associated peptidase YedK